MQRRIRVCGLVVAMVGTGLAFIPFAGFGATSAKRPPGVHASSLPLVDGDRWSSTLVGDQLRLQLPATPQRPRAASLSLQTTAVARGPSQHPVSATRVTNAGEHIELHRDTHVEQLRLGATSVEQRWLFDDEPEGTGDLLVQVAVEGMAFASSSADGLLFADAGRHARYTHATWVEADGRRTHVDAAWSGEVIELRVPSALLERSAYPAVLDPTISEPVELGELGHTVSSVRTEDPHVAFDGTSYWVAWTSAGTQRRVARVSEDGELLDPTPLPLSGAVAGFQLACATGTCAAVWSEGDSMYFRWLRTVAGEAAAGPPVVLATGTASSMTSDGARFLVTWSEGPSAQLFDSEGAAMSLPVLLPTGSVQPTEVASAFGGGHYLVAWQGAGISCARITAAGVLADSAALVLGPRVGGVAATYERFLTVGLDQEDFIVVWDTFGSRTLESESLSGVPYSVMLREIVGRRVSTLGTLPEPVQLIATSPSNHLTEPSLSRGPEGLTLLFMAETAYLQQTSIDLFPHIGRLTPGALSLGTVHEFDVGADGRIASGTTSEMVVHSHGSPYGQERLYGHMIAGGGSPVGDAFPISVALTSHTSPRWFSGDGTHLATWLAPTTNVLVVGGDGVPAGDPSRSTALPAPIDAAASDGVLFHLWLGDRYRDGYQGNGYIYQRVSEQGEVVHEARSEDGLVLSAAFDGERVRVVHFEDRPGIGAQLSVALTDTNGAPLEAGRVVIGTTPDVRTATILRDEERLVVVHRSGGPYDPGPLRGAILERTGQALSLLHSFEVPDWGGSDLSLFRVLDEYWVMGGGNTGRLTSEGTVIDVRRVDWWPSELHGNPIQNLLSDGDRLIGVSAGNVVGLGLDSMGAFEVSFSQSLLLTPAPRIAAVASLDSGRIGVIYVVNEPSTSAPTRARLITASPECGNERREAEEACDSGPLSSNSMPDACRLDCTLPRCGDGVVDTGEACDDGVASASCTALCGMPTCGDGNPDDGEACDDGPSNANTPDTCRANCTLPTCGDGILDQGESCDDGPRNATRWNTCQPDCTLPRCGDGVLGTGEACDQGELNGDAPNRCRRDCKLPRCGDGVIDDAEECDDGADNRDDVADHCRTDCRLPHCGDEQVDTGELCDYYGAQTLPGRCQCACGNGHTEPGEECDWGSTNPNVSNNCSRTCRWETVSDAGVGGGGRGSCAVAAAGKGNARAYGLLVLGLVLSLRRSRSRARCSWKSKRTHDSVGVRDGLAPHESAVTGPVRKHA